MFPNLQFLLTLNYIKKDNFKIGFPLNIDFLGLQIAFLFTSKFFRVLMIIDIILKKRRIPLKFINFSKYIWLGGVKITPMPSPLTFLSSKI